MSKAGRSGDATGVEDSSAKSNAMRTSAADAPRSSDTLSDEVCVGLLHYCEEDDVSLLAFQVKRLLEVNQAPPTPRRPTMTFCDLNATAPGSVITLRIVVSSGA